MNKKDPFYIKQYSKIDPRRLVPTIKNRWNNLIAKNKYRNYALPILEISYLPELELNLSWQNTALKEKDIRYLLLVCSLCVQYELEGSFAEIGCYRGVTTRFLGDFVNPRSYFAIDPFVGYGGSHVDYTIFKATIDETDNIHHLCQTSGDAFRSWTNGPLAFVFIDAVHDYPNASFDINAWGSLLVKGGFLAAHDTDNPGFAGARRAVFEATKHGFEIFAHPPNLTILRKLDDGRLK